MTKGLTYLIVGTTMTIGGYGPVLFGSSLISGWSILGSFVGLIAGIFIVFKLSRSF